MLTDKVVFSEIRTDPKYFNDFKMNNILWAQEFEGILEGKDVVVSKPSLTVLDLGKMLLQSVKEADITKVLELMGRGAPFTTDWLGTTALHIAAMNNSYEICQILLKGGINKDAKTKVDRTPLHFAVFEGHESIVELLLNYKCDVDVKDMLKMTALHWAIEKKFKNIVRLLLKHGADTTIASKFDKTPESIAIETGQNFFLQELELARQMRQQSQEQAQKATESLIYEMQQQSQMEANEAANNIEFDPEPNTSYDLSATIAAKSSNLIEDVVESESNDIVMTKNVPNIYSPSNNIIDSNSESNMEDEDMKYVEPIVQLQNLDEPKHIHTLRLLKNHGISMLAEEEDTANNLLTSALQSGRKLVLSEAGKKCLNETKFSRPSSNTISQQSTVQTQKQSLDNNSSPIKGIKKAPILVRTKSANIKPNKNIKVITMDMFKQMYAGKVISSVRPITTNLARQTDNSTINVRHPIAKITKISGIRKTPQMVKSIQVQGFQNAGSKSSYSRVQQLENDELPPNIIQVGSDSDIDDETECNNDINALNRVNSSSIASISNSHSLNLNNNRIYTNKNPIISRTPSSSSANNIITAPSIPLLDIPEICRQLFDLRKQTEDLQKQLELSKKQSEEYKLRLDRLEKENLERLNKETYS